MKYAMLCAILLASTNGECLPSAKRTVWRSASAFQLTITLKTPLPPSSTLTVPLKTLLINAGGTHTWSKRFNMGNSDGATFTTDSSGSITQWLVNGAKSRRAQFATNNEANNVLDTIYFKCGGAGSRNDPGVWSRTE
jgi:hypothetical protein